MATFQQRGDKWRAIVRRQGFQSKSRTFPSKTAARVWAERTERELANSEASGIADAEDYTLNELIDWYEQAVGARRRVTQTQRGNLTRVRESLGSKIASRLTVSDVVDHARRRCQGDHFNSKGIKVPACSPQTMTIEIGYLGGALSLARSMNRIAVDRDVVADARPALRLLKLTAKSKKRDRRPTQAELDQLRKHFEASAWRSTIPMADIIDFAMATGRRESEITRLLWEDVDTSNGTALLRDAKHPREKEGNHRRFPLLGVAWDISIRQPRKKDDDRIFPFNSKSVGTAFTRACIKLGIKDLHFHDLRHEATSRLFEQGYSIEQVATVTLHTSWTELKRYTQIRPESLHRDGKFSKR